MSLIDEPFACSGSPCRALSLLTVHAATCAATCSPRPHSSRLSLMCAYCARALRCKSFAARTLLKPTLESAAWQDRCRAWNHANATAPGGLSEGGCRSGSGSSGCGGSRTGSGQSGSRIGSGCSGWGGSRIGSGVLSGDGGEGEGEGGGGNGNGGRLGGSWAPSPL